MPTKNNSTHLNEMHEEDFLNYLLLEAGFIPEEDDFDQLKAELEPLLMDTIMTKVFETLSDDQREEVMKLFDAGKEAEALQKIEKMIPDYDNFLADVFQQFGDDYLANIELPE